MRTYVGERSAYGVRVAVLEEGKRPRALAPRNDIRCHWPDGFEWGYVGFGPAQLALALLVDHLEDERDSLEFYQDFTREVVADLPFWGWEMTSGQIDESLSRILREISLGNKPTALDRSGEKDTGLDESGPKAGGETRVTWIGGPKFDRFAGRNFEAP